MRAQEFDNPKEKFAVMFRKFLPLAMKIIGLESLPKFVFDKNLNTGEQPSFGAYSIDNQTLFVALANRHPNDILRTVAHELVHYKQDTAHELKDNSGMTGSPEENQANQVAGIVMRHFNKRYPEFLKNKPIISESAGDRGDIPTGPGEQLIPFPQGTTMVDVSDVYDWYKLGMVISDLDDADPKMFGQGAPHTVIAFGSEEEEHKLLPLLKRLGLKVHDIDRPEDVKKAIPAKMLAKDLAETIRKMGSQYRLVSKSGKNLGTYPSKSGAEKRERQVQYFKHVDEKLNRTGSNELVIFDIDDTLLHTTAQIKVIKDGKPIRSLTNQEFNNYKLGPGEEFDFGEFRNAQKFEEESVPIGPMLDKLKQDLASGKNVVMLTARADFDNQKAVWRTFKRHGIDINRDVHLFRAGNLPGSESPAVKKAIHVSKWLNTGNYSKIVMYDDSEKNLTVFKSLEKKFPDVEFEAHHVSEEGDTKQVENFADGRNPQDKGDSARHGIRKGITIAQLKKIRSSDSASPRKKQLAHWQINMRQGRKK
jgi:hypothetical protein